MRIRAETKADSAAVRAVNEAAFETPAEADLVDRLRPHASRVVDTSGYVSFAGTTYSAGRGHRGKPVQVSLVGATVHERGVHAFDDRRVAVAGGC